MPSDWPSGKISGLKARGNIEISLEWENGNLKSAILVAQKNKTAKVNYQGKTIEIELNGNKPVRLNLDNFKQ